MPKGVLLVASLAVATAWAQEPDRQTFRAATRLVPVEVIVHDRDGRPIADLTAADFKVFEDGKEQNVEFFQVNVARPSGATATPAPGGAGGVRSDPAAPALGANLHTNRPNGGVPLTATVVLFDRLNTRFEDQVQARAEIVKFLGQIKPDERVALYVLESNAIRVLHDFTRDSGSLVRAIARYRPQTSIEQQAADAPPPPSSPIGVAGVDVETEAWLLQTTQMVANEFLRRRAQNALAALETIGHHLAGIPGRKNVVWISSAFPLSFAETVGSAPGAPSMATTFSAPLMRAANAISTANVAIYPVDTSGLVASYTGVAQMPTTVGIGRAAAPIVNRGTMTATSANTDVMHEIAERTGGRAYTNTNAIGAAIGKAMDDGRVSYSLGYYPTNQKWDSKFRRVKVEVRRSGTDVRHRSGYLALPSEVAKGDSTLADLARSSLDATAIGLIVNAEGSNVGIKVDAGGITLRPAGNLFDVAIDILIAHSMPNGELVKSFDKTLNLQLSREQRDQILQEGFTMSRTVDIRPSAAALHVVVRDAPSGRAGSVSIPVQNTR
jgi:VWFA-related protein